jgi:outer membrane protein OmpA-like peptidoglycan-associated protein
MAMKYCIAAISFLLASAPASAGLQQFQSPLDAVKWTASSSKKHCSLDHDIPLYGRATFAQSAGGALGFTLTARREARREKDRAHLRSNPPAWKHQVAMVDLGEIAIHQGKTPFQLGESLSRRLLAELQKGMFPTFSYRDWADARDQVTVALPGIRIKDALDEFVRCIDQLPVFTFADFQNSRVYFDSGKHRLDTKARQRLDDLAIYLKTDPKVANIKIQAHTDSIGLRRMNDQLGQRRAEAVKNYLVARGVDPGKFQLKSYGERKPVKSNHTPEGRAENRRAIVILVK